MNEAIYFAYVTSYPLATFENGRIKTIMIPVGVTAEGYLQLRNGAIRAGSEIYVIKGDLDSFLEGVNMALPQSTFSDNAVSVFACFSREMRLEDRYEEEIAAIDRKHAHQAEGALSFGEFTNCNEKNELRLLAGACIVTNR